VDYWPQSAWKYAVLADKLRVSRRWTMRATLLHALRMTRSVASPAHD
jgi:hypothetical protein